MITCSKGGIFKPKVLLSTISTQPIVEPADIHEPLADPKWVQAMNEEYSALMRSNT